MKSRGLKPAAVSWEGGMRTTRFMLSLFSFLMFAGLLPGEGVFGSPEEERFEAKRRDMVEFQIKARGVTDSRVLAAMLKVRRHLFVPKSEEERAYEDHAMPIGLNQTISQPYIVALMTELAGIQPSDRILEIGTGSGYQTAVLAELATNIFSIEIIKELADEARDRLNKLGYQNIKVRNADGYEGWPEEAPFDAIVVTAAAPEIPQKLIAQLAPGGRLVIPLGDLFQELTRITKNKDGTVTKEHVIPVRFVPMVHGKK